MSVGFLVRVRMESVVIEVVRLEELVEIYFNYVDVVLVEFYREDYGFFFLSRFEVIGYLFLCSFS